MSTLPTFRYHPDPIATGSIEESPNECLSCGQARGYIYTGSVYAEDDFENDICPWCIADGSAAEQFEATFSDGYSLTEADVSDEIVEEVTKRTPGFECWQSEVWLTCCDDACEFHGDATKSDLQAVDEDDLEDMLAEWDLSMSEWKQLVKSYQPKGDPAVYKFVCRHCKQAKYNMDCS
jgi:uncharacterized protein CbrC (UPF0167 family)